MLGAFALGWAVIYADRTCMYPLLSIIAEKFSLSSAEVGSITSAYFLFYVLMQIPAGVAGDRYGLKKVLLFMYGLAGIGIVGLGIFGTSYVALLFFVSLHGIGAGAYYPVAYGTVMQIVPAHKRGFSSAVIGMGMALGLLAGLAMSGPVYEALKDFRIPFLILSVPTFLMIFYFNSKVPDVKSLKTPNWQDFKEILQNRTLWLINISTFTALYGFWVIITWGPTFLKTERGFSLGQAGLFTGLIALSSLPASLLWGKLSDKFGRKRVAIFVVPASGICLYLLSVVQSEMTILMVLLLFGLFANSAFAPIMVAWTGDVITKKHKGLMGAAIGVFNSVIMLSAVVAPAISGWIRDRTGSLVPAIILGSVLTLVGTIILVCIREDNYLES